MGIRLRPRLHRLRELAEDGRGFVNPAGRSRVLGRIFRSAAQKPRAPSPTAIFGVMAKPRCLRSSSTSDQLSSLSRYPSWTAIGSLFSLFGGSHEDENALTIVVAVPNAEVNAVGPRVDVLGLGEIATAPLLLPFDAGRCESGDCCRRESSCTRSDQGLECRLEVARRASLQVEPGDHLVRVLRSTKVGGGIFEKRKRPRRDGPIRDDPEGEAGSPPEATHRSVPPAPAGGRRATPAEGPPRRRRPRVN